MRNLKWLVIPLLLAASLVVGISFIPLFPNDPFSDIGIRYLNHMDELPSSQIMALKYKHAKNTPRYDLGLFGNSRIIMVKLDIFKKKYPRPFNFAVAGSSFRQSVLFLKELETIQRAPRTAVIMFDHVALNFDPPPFFPLPPKLWATILGEMVGIAGLPHARRSYFNTLAHNGLKQIGLDIQSVFKFDLLQLRLNTIITSRSLFGAVTRLPRQKIPYFKGGSRGETVSRIPVEIAVPGPSDGPHFPALEYYISLLAGLKEKVQIIVYESPIAPSISAQVENTLHPTKKWVRRRFFAACKTWGVKCIPSPAIIGDPEGGYWRGQNHGPGRPIGLWIQNELAEYVKSLAVTPAPIVR